MRAFNEANTGKEENGSQYAVNDQGFHLLAPARRVEENHRCINKPYNAQYRQDNAKGSFRIHSPCFGGYKCKKTAKRESRLGEGLRGRRSGRGKRELLLNYHSLPNPTKTYI